MIHTLLIDDHWAIRDGIERAFQRTNDITLVAAVESLAAATDVLRRGAPPVHVVLLDVYLRNESGIEAISHLRRLSPTSAVLMLSMLQEDPHAIHAIEQGAAGFVSKGGTAAELLDAVRVVASGRRYVTPNVGHLLAERLRASNALSARESEIVRLFAGGHRCGTIARMLALSPKTVSAHKANAKRKIGVISDADLIRWTIEHRVA